MLNILIIIWGVSGLVAIIQGEYALGGALLGLGVLGFEINDLKQG